MPLVLLLLGGLGLIAMLSSGHSAALPAIGGPLGWRWIRVQPTNGLQLVPYGSLFAIRAELVTPSTPLVVAALQRLANSQTVITELQTAPPGTAPPAGWPRDDDGAPAYRATARVTDPAGMLVAWTSPSIWVWQHA